MSVKMTELILDEIRQTQQDLKLFIEAVEVRITLRVEELNKRLNSSREK